MSSEEYSEEECDEEEWDEEEEWEEDDDDGDDLGDDSLWRSKPGEKKPFVDPLLRRQEMQKKQTQPNWMKKKKGGFVDPLSRKKSGGSATPEFMKIGLKKRGEFVDPAEQRG